MVDIAITRPKLAATNVVNETLAADTPVVTSSYIELRVFVDDLTIDNQVIAADPGISWTGAVITGPAGTFDNVREGDVISSSTGWVSSQLVTAVNVDGSQVTASASADADGNNEEITFTASDIDSTVYFLRLNHSTTGSILNVTPVISCLDGAAVADGSVDDGSDEVVFTDGTQKTLAGVAINLDQFLTNARVARTNS